MVQTRAGRQAKGWIDSWLLPKVYGIANHYLGGGLASELMAVFCAAGL